MSRATDNFQRLIDIVDELRQKCPWDMVQTKETIRHLTIEETYELVDAIVDNDYQEMKIELGDLLMHMIFYSSLARDDGHFDIADVLETQINKLIRRHPHIYGDLQGASQEQIKGNWEKIKAEEKAEKGVKKISVLDGVPNQLPSLIKAQRMQEKAASQGFDWDNKEQVWEKVQEEIQEFAEAKSPEEQAAEMGDLLFSLVNYCRFLGINADDALSQTNHKFKTRFQHVEDRARESGRKLPELDLEEMDAYWEEAKG